jgi:hypothetical protein
MMMNIVRPTASPAAPKAIPHRPGILRPNFSLQPSAFSLLFSVSVFTRGWNLRSATYHTPPFYIVYKLLQGKKTRQAEYTIINTNSYAKRKPTGNT